MVRTIIECVKRVGSHISAWIGTAATAVGVASDVTGDNGTIPAVVWWALAVGALFWTALRIEYELQQAKDADPDPDMTFFDLMEFALGFREWEFGQPGVTDLIQQVQNYARLAKLHVWGRRDPQGGLKGPLSRIDPEYWEFYQFDIVLLTVGDTATEKWRIGGPDLPIYADLHFSRREVRRLFNRYRRRLIWRSPFHWSTA